MTRPSTSVRIVLPALLASISVASAGLMTAQPSPLSIALGALVVLGSAIAISLEPLAGAVVGLAVSAVVVGASRTFGIWNESVFLPTVLACTGTIATAWLSGLIGLRIRQGARARAGWSGNTPAVGSLGLADAATGEALLANDILRAQHVATPLSVLRFVVRARPTGTAADRIQACRAVARALDATIHAIDIPFAYADNDMAVILPGTDGRGARLLCERITSAVGAATILSTGRTRQPLGDFATVSVGLAEFPMDGETAIALVEAAHPENARGRARAAARPSDTQRVLHGDPSPETSGQTTGDTEDAGRPWTAVGPGRVMDATAGDLPARSAA